MQRGNCSPAPPASYRLPDRPGVPTGHPASVARNAVHRPRTALAENRHLPRAWQGISIVIAPRYASTGSAAAGTAAAAATGIRIRCSNALSAALAPSPAAMTICLYGTVVQSPAANTPGRLVWPRASITTSPDGLSATWPLSQSVLGTRP